MHAVPHLAQNPGDAAGSLDQKSANDCGVTRVHVVTSECRYNPRGEVCCIYLHACAFIAHVLAYYSMFLYVFFIFCCRHWRKKAMYVRVGDRRICHSAAQ